MMERTQRRARPSIEGLECRNLLNGAKNPTVHALATTAPTGTGTVTTSTTTQFNYTTVDGARVRVTLNGPGELTGTALDANGNLNLVYNDTSIFTSIIGTVSGGSGQANIGTIKNASVPLSSLTGLGGTLIGRISLKQFDLVSGGNINLTPGVNELFLNAVTSNSQMHLRDTPLNTTLGISTSVDPITGAGLGYAGNQPYRTAVSGTSLNGVTNNTGLTGVYNAGTLDPTITGFPSTNNGAISGAIPIIPTIGNGQNVRGTPGLTQTQVSNGRSLTYAFGTTTETANAIRLTSVAGFFVPGANLIEPRDNSLPIDGGRVAPPGVILNINHVNGGTTALNPPLGNANIFGYDPATNRLIRFDAVTGAVLNTINLAGAGLAGGQGGVALARNGTELVALVGAGTTVSAYDALSGILVGQFTTARDISGIASTNGITVLVDANILTNQAYEEINVAGSLAVGHTVPIGTFYAPSQEFTLAGGATGVAGTGNIYALGTGYFNTSTPNVMQAGIITLTPTTSGVISEASRTALTSGGANVPGANGTITGDTSRAVGSIGSNLALDTGVSNGKNVLALLSPTTLASQGSVSLNYGNPLSDLSESFHPEIAGSALIDVQGNVQSFTAQTVRGLVFNGAGNLNLIKARNVANSSVVGFPLSHVDINVRNNVSIVTTSRLVGDRNGVTVNASQRVLGPLTLPS